MQSNANLYPTRRLALPTFSTFSSSQTPPLDPSSAEPQLGASSPPPAPTWPPRPLPKQCFQWCGMSRRSWCVTPRLGVSLANRVFSGEILTLSWDLSSCWGKVGETWNSLFERCSHTCLSCWWLVAGGGGCCWVVVVAAKMFYVSSNSPQSLRNLNLISSPGGISFIRRIHFPPWINNQPNNHRQGKHLSI